MTQLEQQQVTLLTTTIVQEAKDCYTGWINEEDGCTAQGETIDEVKSELLKVYWIKHCVEHNRQRSKNKIITLFDYIAEDYMRIMEDVKVGITSYTVIKNWLIYSRYDYYIKTGENVSKSVFYTSEDNKVSENWVYSIIKKMEMEV